MITGNVGRSPFLHPAIQTRLSCLDVFKLLLYPMTVSMRVVQTVGGGCVWDVSDCTSGTMLLQSDLACKHA